jgi:uncharacterized cupredoxin-like copper-binding protein
MTMPRLLFSLPALAALALAIGACTPAASLSPSPSATAAAGTTVNVTLQEFAIVPSPATAPAGAVTFHVTNSGPNEVHEIVVIKTDLAPDALPTGADGAVDEEAEGLEPVDEIEDIAVGATEDLKVNLEAGNYVLICNIVEDDVAHYDSGMRTAFMVE